MLCRLDESCLWLLARTPQTDAALQNDLIARAKALNSAAEKLISADDLSPESSSSQDQYHRHVSDAADRSFGADLLEPQAQ